MDLRNLRYFVATVEEGSISAASVRCFVAQPSITMAIAKLEGELDCQLLIRHRKGCTVTPEGEKLYHLAMDLLHHAEGVRNAFAPVEKPKVVRLAVDRSIRVGAVEQLCRDAGRHCRIELVSDSQADDARLIPRSQCRANEAFVPLSTENYALLVPADNIIAHKRDIELQDLDGQSVIERIHCENRQRFEQLMHQLGIVMHTVARVETEEWAQALVAAGLGICFAPLPAGYTDPRFVVRPVSELFLQLSELEEQNLQGNLQKPYREIGIAAKKSELSTLFSVWPSLESAESSPQ